MFSPAVGRGPPKSGMRVHREGGLNWSQNQSDRSTWWRARGRRSFGGSPPPLPWGAFSTFSTAVQEFYFTSPASCC